MEIKTQNVQCYTFCSKAAPSSGKSFVHGAEKLHDSNYSDRMGEQCVCIVQDKAGIILSTGCSQASSYILLSFIKESRLPNTVRR